MKSFIALLFLLLLGSCKREVDPKVRESACNDPDKVSVGMCHLMGGKSVKDKK